MQKFKYAFTQQIIAAEIQPKTNAIPIGFMDIILPAFININGKTINDSLYSKSLKPYFKLSEYKSATICIK